MSRTLNWATGYRIIRTIYPPEDLFEDVADREDWDLLASAEAKLNPRIRDRVGNLALVPPARRPHGPTASIVMGAFTHISLDRQCRFSPGTYGVWRCGDRLEVALAETAHHFQRFMRMTNEPSADADFRLLTCALHGDVEVAPDACLIAPDLEPAQTFARKARHAGRDGIMFDSSRYPNGHGAVMFWPDCLTLPILQSQQFRYRWDGAKMTHYLMHGDTAWTPWPIAGVA